jgi:hypothetical protein
MPRSITACAATSGIFICGAATHDCKRGSVCGMRLSGRQAHRHRGGLAGRQTRSIVSIAAATALLHDFDGCWIDLPNPSARSNRWARTAVRLSPPHLTSLQLVRQCAGGKHSEPPERLTAAHAAQRTEAPVPHLPRDWARPYHIFAGTATGRGRVRRRY